MHDNNKKQTTLSSNTQGIPWVLEALEPGIGTKTIITGTEPLNLWSEVLNPGV